MTQRRGSNSPQSIRLPLPPGKVLVFDHIRGRVFVANQLEVGWAKPSKPSKFARWLRRLSR